MVIQNIGMPRKIMSNYKKIDIKELVEKDILFEKNNISEILEKIEKIATWEDIKVFYENEKPVFGATGLNDQWVYKKDVVSPEMWRAIYKYSYEYGSVMHSNCDYHNVDENILSNENCKLLDFGSGPNPTIANNYACQFYLVKINDTSVINLKKGFKNRSNIKIFNCLSDVVKLNIKFDVAFSSETLEHVRYINEHLYILYNLCKEDGQFYLQYPFDHDCGGHVYGLYKDTITRETFLTIGH